eukprot:SAG31_NODE_20011_length_586_cov_0.932238_2_plen_48_part_00
MMLLAQSLLALAAGMALRDRDPRDLDATFKRTAPGALEAETAACCRG